jgi:hypothetical protein
MAETTVLDLTGLPLGLGNATRYHQNSTTVWARQITLQFVVKTVDGDITGNPGDWIVEEELAEGVRGERWVVRGHMFKHLYKM